MNDNVRLKNNIKAARMACGLSQRALAEKIGVSRNTISSIETGQFNPTAKVALQLCIALDKKFEQLFYLEKMKVTESDERSLEKLSPKSL